MSARTMTEERWNDEAAADIVTMLRGMDGSPDHVGILDDMHQQVMYELDRNLARAIAYRLLRLADELPAPRILLRSAAVDEALRENDG